MNYLLRWLEEANDLGRLVFLTGRPGVGKTSVLLRAVKDLRARGLRIGGMISREAGFYRQMNNVS